MMVMGVGALVKNRGVWITSLVYIRGFYPPHFILFRGSQMYHFNHYFLVRQGVIRVQNEVMYPSYIFLPVRSCGLSLPKSIFELKNHPNKSEI